VIVKALLILCIVGLIATIEVQDRTIRQQRFLIQNMAANPLCMAAPTKTAAQVAKEMHPVRKAHKAVLRHVYFTTPNPAQKVV
jgi:hypothetical protein